MVGVLGASSRVDADHRLVSRSWSPELPRFYFPTPGGGPPRRSRPVGGAPVSVFGALPLGDSGETLAFSWLNIMFLKHRSLGSTPLRFLLRPSAGQFKRVPTLMFRMAGVRQLSTCGHRQFSHGNLSRGVLDTVGLMQLLIVTVLVRQARHQGIGGGAAGARRGRPVQCAYIHARHSPDHPGLPGHGREHSAQLLRARASAKMGDSGRGEQEHPHRVRLSHRDERRAVHVVVAGCMELLYRPLIQGEHRLHNMECAIACSTSSSTPYALSPWSSVHRAQGETRRGRAGSRKGATEIAIAPNSSGTTLLLQQQGQWESLLFAIQRVHVSGGESRAGHRVGGAIELFGNRLLPFGV
ncbi:hypothetical protein Q5P01_000819 [Channa striata]|uniref:Uncharacterized protein n=1 Tax=Channa striata TaxID=64152 RepID=A0AA88II63_CHASR|nr:hypothetical protein Q5P01_000819 [Channa striata]